ncbi:MAG: sulfatase [Tannerellaceae bacterium]|nr:sulfatase [Tannerellaceae bacterium]
MKNKMLHLLSLAGGLSMMNTVSAAEQPNIIIVFIDDFGYGDLGCYGNTVHRTPHLDRMAKEGILLSNFYVASSVSTPSRAALLTGSYPRRISMHVNADPTPLHSTGRQVLFPVSHKGLNPSEITIAELLKEKGYATACIGKWHLGDQLAFLPTRQGFDYYFGIPYSNDMDREYCPLPLMEQEEVIEAPVNQDSLTLRYTAKTIEFIKSHKERPFFIYLPHNMTHDPLAASPAFKGKSQNGLYGDATEELDWSMGEIFTVLKEEGLDENTLVIFTSDNGAQEVFGGSNYPLRGEKGTTYEGGFRVPCLMRWPGTIPAGQTSDALITTMDFLPTIAYYCGLKVPDDRIIDGHNVNRILEGETGSSPTEIFYYYQKQQLQAVRWGKWKYHLPLEQRIKGPHFPDTERYPAELYDLDLDISESKNVIDQHPEIVSHMHRLIEQVREDMGDWGYEGKNQRPAGIIDEPFPRLPK